MAKRKKSSSPDRGARRSTRLKKIAEADSTDSFALDAPTKDNPICKDDHEPPKASLLGTPAEIRNRIYGLVLVNRYTISADVGARLDEPALLQTCRQIRAEASKIFLSQNEFEWGMEDCKLCPQREHWLWKKVPSDKTFPYHDPVIIWDNLLEWLKLHHAGLDPAFHKVDDIFDWDDLYPKTWVLNLFEMVESLRGQSWETTARLLRQTRQLLVNAEKTINGNDEGIALFY